MIFAYFGLVNAEVLLAEKDRIIAQQASQLADQQAQIAMLKAEMDQLKRLIYGQQRERFIPEQPSAQMQLDLGQLQDATEVFETEQLSYERKKGVKKRPNHHGRLPLPEHLPRKIVVIEPDVDTTDMVKIGEEVTETLELEEARLFVLREVRPKYVEKTLDEQGEQQSRLHIAPQPEKTVSQNHRRDLSAGPHPDEQIC